VLELAVAGVEARIRELVQAHRPEREHLVDAELGRSRPTSSTTGSSSTGSRPTLTGCSSQLRSASSSAQ
jgi:hypothetical protein